MIPIGVKVPGTCGKSGPVDGDGRWERAERAWHLWEGSTGRVGRFVDV